MSKRVVVIGGGFAGINLVKYLIKSSDFEVTLVDKNNYNFFPPLLYQVSTGFLDPSSITFPFRNLFRGRQNFRFRMGELLEVKPELKQIVLDTGKLSYDYLVMATGTQTNFFGLDQCQRYAIPMKTLEDALEMRNLLLLHLEQATRINDKSERLPYLNMVIAGGGPTGVEISGIFAELRNNTIRKEFPELIGSGSKIYLVNGGGELLSPMSKKSQEYTYKKLQDMGVEILLNTRVVDFDGEKVMMKDGSHIYSKNLIWATGVTGYKFQGIPDEVYKRGNRIEVDAYNKITGQEAIYAIGDSSICYADPSFPEGHPQLAQVAMQQGVLLAKNLKRQNSNKGQIPFIYKDRGSMAIIGSNKAVADVPSPRLHLNGFIAWVAWLFVHLFALIDYRNRVRTFYNWSTEYLTKNQDLRLIIRPKKSISSTDDSKG